MKAGPEDAVREEPVTAWQPLRERVLPPAAAGGLLLLLVWTYWPALNGGWVWDDDLEVAHNPVVHGGVRALGAIWRGNGAYDYLPLKTSVEWVEWHVWGGNTAGYHWLNLALHAASAWLLWRLLTRIFGIAGRRAVDGGGSAASADSPWRWAAWFAAAVFAFHPLAVESVAWIAELKNTLSLALMLVSANRYVRFDSSRRRSDYALAVASFGAALLAKTSVVMFPFAILLFAWWRRGRLEWRDAARAAPFFALSLGLGLVTVAFQQGRTVAGALVLEPFAVRLAAVGLKAGFYLFKFVAPVQLTPIYGRWAPAAEIAGGGALWILFVAGFIALWRKRASWGRHALFGFGFFALNLFPIAGLIPMAFLQVGPVSDHFAYVPVLGLSALAGAVIGWLATRARAAAGLLGAAAIAALAVASHGYAGTFASNEAFWGRAYARNPDSWTAANDFGIALTGSGDLPKAAGVLERAVALDPRNSEGWYNLGAAYAAARRHREAAAAFERALRLNPRFARAWNNLGTSAEALGEPDRAVADFRRAIADDPHLAEAHNNLGLALSRDGRWDQAIAEYRAALRLDPQLALAYSNWGDALARAGRMPQAIAEYDAALRLDPRLISAGINRSNAWLSLGELAKAIAGYEAVLRIEPGNQAARTNLAHAQVLQAAGRP